jgi:hypothetical protein
MAEYTEKEWKKILTERFGENILDWKFKCPACGKITSGAEFKEVGAKPNDIFQKCIGNFKGQGKPDPENNQERCNWKAYGLFKLGDVVIADEGNEIDVFPIADKSI